MFFGHCQCFLYKIIAFRRYWTIFEICTRMNQEERPKGIQGREKGGKTRFIFSFLRGEHDARANHGANSGDEARQWEGEPGHTNLKFKYTRLKKLFNLTAQQIDFAVTFNFGLMKFLQFDLLQKPFA